MTVSTNSEWRAAAIYCVLALSIGAAAVSSAQDATKAASCKRGELRSYATIHSLGFEWDIEGDGNHDATCKVAYRRDDEKQWHDALPLFRVDYYGWYNDRKVLADRPYNMLAGSVFFLRPGALYHVKLTLNDPDGGDAERTVIIRTRPVPRLVARRTLHVIPGKAGGSGTEGDPFQGIAAADAVAKPGDLFLLHKGDYGRVVLARGGGTTQYIGWKAAGDGAAVLEQAQLRASHVWIEGLSFESMTQKVGLRAAAACEGVVVKANRFKTYNYAVLLSRTSRAWTITDNTIEGDSAGGIKGEGVELAKSEGHTVAYNRISKHADGVSYPLRNCDIFGNDIFEVSDDGLEPDYGYGNIRMWGNRIHAKNAGLSFQGMLGAPWYFIRNQVISNGHVLKLRVCDRFLMTNNTFVAWGTMADHAQALLPAFTRNNLWIKAGPNGWIFRVWVPKDEKKLAYIARHVMLGEYKATWKTDMDYDGFDWTRKKKHPRLPAADPFIWRDKRLYDIESLTKEVGIEAHGMKVEATDIFASYAVPTEPGWITPPPLLTLRREGKAIDAGVPLPNIAEEFTGKAPDLGAFELGMPTPHYGPRDAATEKRIENHWVLPHQR